MILDVLVVGAGLSGMHLAQRLSLVKQCQFKLLEASGLVGGRLRNDNVHNQIDLGGAWIWPEFQPKMARLVSSLGVQTFAQPDDPSSTRIVGGAVRLVEKLAEQVPSDNIKLNSPVISCSLKKNNTASNDSQTCSEGDYIEIKTANQEVFQAKRVVFAAPPKLIAKHITFDPPLNTEKWHAMMQSETWMAGVTKIALEYPKRFWDLSSSNMGLPPVTGGPAFQVYDSSTKNNDVVALTFFALVPHTSPAYSDEKRLAQMVAEQMATVWKAMRRGSFAAQAPSYTNYHVHRWPLETYISEDDKPVGINPHPSPVRHLATNDWDGRLLFAGSEADLGSPGVMEGAVGAAERVFKDLEPMLVAKEVNTKQSTTKEKS